MIGSIIMTELVFWIKRIYISKSKQHHPFHHHQMLFYRPFRRTKLNDPFIPPRREYPATSPFPKKIHTYI